MGGSVSIYFTDVEVFARELTDVFIGNKLSIFDMWNELFKSIGAIYWNICIVHFVDTGSGITMRIPDTISDIDDYKSTNDHVLVLDNHGIFYPIYNVQHETFFKDGSVNVKRYGHDHPIIGEIHKLVDHFLRNRYKMHVFNLSFIRKFAVREKQTINTLYINRGNKCYGVNIGGVYIPIVESSYTGIGFNIKLEPPSPSDLPSWSKLSRFMEHVNTYSSDLYGSAILSVENWMIHSSRIIGFRCRGVNYMFQPIGCASLLSKAIGDSLKCCIGQGGRGDKDETLCSALVKISDKYTIMLYDPSTVNKVIHDESKPQEDARIRQLPKSIYSVYLYQYIIVELNNIIHNQRNMDIRGSLHTILKKYSPSNSMGKELYALLGKYPEDYKAIQKLMYGSTTASVDSGDTAQMLDKKEIEDIVTSSVFTFDRVFEAKISGMKHHDLVVYLTSILDPHVTITDKPGVGNLHNIITSCATSTASSYCKDKKMMITKKDYTTYIDILASDLMKPSKVKHILGATTHAVFDYFKFIIRPDEHIHVSI
jgi:hypothetical protein